MVATAKIYPYTSECAALFSLETKRTRIYLPNLNCTTLAIGRMRISDLGIENGDGGGPYTTINDSQIAVSCCYVRSFLESTRAVFLRGEYISRAQSSPTHCGPVTR